MPGGGPTAIRALMRPGARHRPGPRGQKGPCPGPRGLSPKPAGAWRVCPRTPCLATLLTTGASALSSRDPGKRTHDCSKPDSPRAACTPHQQRSGWNPPRRGTGIRESKQEEGQPAWKLPVVRAPEWKSPGCLPPRGLLVRCLPSVGGDVGGPKSCALTPGVLRRTSTPERGSQRARNQVPTPAWGQARHQLGYRPSWTAQRPAAVRTAAWQRRLRRAPRGVEPTPAWGHGSQPLAPTPPEGGPGARSTSPLVKHSQCRQPP